jgi:DNA-binding MarR family transcriptional regulator
VSEGSKRRLKMWIRLLGVTRSAENALREYLRVNHDTTLPRFDVMAALWRRRDGVTMSELSRMLLVSNGNATTVVDRLEADGLVARRPSEADRRTVHVALTAEGRRPSRPWPRATRPRWRGCLPASPRPTSTP